MATTPASGSTTPPKRDDWNQTMADVKRLVEALHSLNPPTLANHEPKPKPKPQAKSEPVSRPKHKIAVHIEIDTA
jgi:hypothetical protein